MIKFAVRADGRLAKTIASQGGIPYPTVRKLLRNKDVKVNGKRVKEDIPVYAGDEVEVYHQSAVNVSPVYEDGNIAVFDKPYGIDVPEFTQAVTASFPTARAVHRLDRNTRGLIVYALTDEAENALIEGFRKRTFRKFYVAEVKGVPHPKAARISAYLQKDAQNSHVSVNRSGRGLPIETAYRVIEERGATSLVEVELITGRTHQIRAHLAFIGHPVVGDGKYGDNKFNHALHANVQRLQAQRMVFAFPASSPLYYLDGKEIALPPAFGSDGNGKSDGSDKGDGSDGSDRDE